MIHRIVTLSGIMTLAASSLLADFTYHEKSTVTGGAMAAMLKMAGVFSKQAREPIETTVSVKGDRMVTRSATHITIVDLSSQTITTVDAQKKNYTVLTFEEMKQKLQQAQQKMQSQKKGDAPAMTFKVSANNTGNTKQVAGLDTRELILKLEMQSTDQKTGQQGTFTVTTDMWLATAIDGYAEVRAFHRRMAEKLNWAPGSNMFAARPDVSEGMAEVYKEIGKLDGMPVLQNIVMGVPVPPADGSQPAANPQPQDQQQQQQSVSRPSLGGALGGALSGRFGKKKQADQPADGQGSSQPGSILEMTTETNGFSSAAVDDAQFAIPAGFKKVQP